VKIIERQSMFDVNIWNRGEWETEGLEPEERYDTWVLCPYKIEEEFAGYGTGQELSELNLVLTDAEAKTMTLGLSRDDGGDYADDSDFWLDSDTLLITYSIVPDRVKEWVKSVDAKHGLEVLERI
jgi:hypothetical protein